ncbi:MAG: condensation domain-containing protein, partial [Acutalibacteraceae bacterium]|nr:condensation domain-containing protein [Acutalibacteraceae bacterium]
KEIDGIKDAAVIARADKNGDKAIFAYFTSDSEMDISEIRDILGETLPEYMIPSYMMQIEVIPVTKNGKLDKRALPEIEVRTTREYVAPTTDMEITVCEIFGNILGVEKVGLNDSFFELGGDSIKAIRIVSKLRDNGYKITVADIMYHKIISKCINCIEIDQRMTYTQEEVNGVVEKTPMIKYFEKSNLVKPYHYNQSKVIDVTGISDEDIVNIFRAIVIKHDMFRAVYRDSQVVIIDSEESKLFDFYSFDYSDSDYEISDIENKCTEIQSSIDLPNGPLLKIAVFNLKNSREMLVAVHHLAIDSISWRILEEDFEIAYKQLVQGEEITLPLKTASFIEWSKAINEYKDSDVFVENKKYWDEIISDIDEYGFVYNKKSDLNTIGYEDVDMLMSVAETTAIKEAAIAFNIDVREFLISALAVAVNKITNQNKLTIILESHGRESIHKDILIDRTVGWFTSIYPVVAVCSGDLKDVVTENKEMMRKVPKNGFDYRLIDNDIEESDFICLNYLGEYGSSEDNESNSDIKSENHTDMILGGMPVAKDNILMNNISFNGSISNGELFFKASYNSAVYSSDDMLDFINCFKNTINELSNFCINYDESVYTASDFDNSMDNDDFANLLDML